MIKFSKPKHQKAGFSLAFVATVVAALVLLLGVLTRLSDAGLGCEGWPSCYGSSLQAGSMDTAPESVLTSTAQIEIFHRYLAAVLGLMVIMLAIISWRRREMEEYPFRLPTLILFLVAWQAVFGMWSVTLKLLPQVVTFHLIAGMVTFSLIWLLTLRLGSRPWELNEKTDLQLQRLRPWLLVLMAALLLQIGLGGWTSANYAAFACSDFPTCQGEWWPDMDFRQGFDFTQPVGPSYLGGKLETEARVAIHVTHRIAGLVLAVLTVIIATPLLRIKNSQVRVLTTTFVMLMLTELLLGVANNLLMAPMLTALLHHLISALLLLVLVALMTGIWLAKPRYQRQES